MSPPLLGRMSAWKRFWLGSTFAAAVLAVWTTRSDAQVIPTVREVLMPPWNALHVLEPWPAPLLDDPDDLADISPEDQPIRHRLRPEYEPPGIRVEDWMFNPTFTAGGFYDSNVFSSSSNVKSDVASQVSAGLRAHTLWERHGIDLRALVQNTSYLQSHSLDETDATFKGTGRFDIDHATQLLNGFQAGYLHEGVGSLSSPAGAIAPTPYTLVSDDMTLRHEFGRFTGSVGARIDSYDYGSTRAQNGTVISQDARDGQIYTAHGRLDYAFSDKLGVFTALEGNSRRLRGTVDQSLNSDGYRALAGVDVQLTHLITGEFAGGYMRQDFASASIGTIQGPAYRAILTWSPSRRLDVHFNAEQIVTESSDTSSTGVLANTLQLGFDYEFRPNVVFSSYGGYEKDSFKGQDRADNVYAVDARIKYLPNSIGSIALYYRYTQRDSNIPEFSFTKHQVGINAAARF